MDMSAAYIAGTQVHFPDVRIVFDRFHVMKLAGEALDAVPKDLRRQGADLAGGLWAIRGNEWTRTGQQLDLRRHLTRALAMPVHPRGAAFFHRRYRRTGLFGYGFSLLKPCPCLLNCRAVGQRFVNQRAEFQ